jgi:RimJ/RimL family protein N-acetyltransferase
LNSFSSNIEWQPTSLESDLIKLLPIQPEDFETLYEVASDPLIWEQHPKKERYKREVFMRFFEHAITHRSAFLIADKATNKIIGSSGYYDFNANDSCITIGYTFLARKYWGGKYNYASKKLLLDYAFQFVDKVYFHIGSDNKRSQLAITKIGAKMVREFITEDKGTEFEYVIEKMHWQMDNF